MKLEAISLGLNNREQEDSAEKSKEVQEPALEKASIMEKAREARLVILEQYLNPLKKYIKESPVLKAVGSNLLNDAGPFGTFKQIHEAIVGKTWDGKKLTPLGRINHVIIHALYLYAIKESTGVLSNPTSAIIHSSSAYTASWFFDMLQYYPNTMSNLAAKLEELLEKTNQKKLLETAKLIREWCGKVDLQKLFFYENKINEEK